MQSKNTTHNTKHGHTSSSGWVSPEYTSWKHMNQRTGNPNHASFHRYGGRGIIVCQRWKGKQGFQNFFTDMGPKPTPDHTLERKNNDGNYEPDNCKWATDQEQKWNMSTNNNISFDGKTMCLPAWAKHTGLPFETLRARMRLDWTPERILTTPYYGPARRGELHRLAAVTNEQAQEIRRLYDSGEVTDFQKLGDMFHIKKANAWRIVRRKSYRAAGE